jgi:hypothetical protein
VTAITETVATNFLGNANLPSTVNAPDVNNGTVTLTWSALEGGTYMVQSTTNFSTWTTNSTTVPAVLNAASFTDNPTDNDRFYRVGRTSVATFDSAGTTIFATNSVAPGGSAYCGQSVALTITLTAPPNLPPAGVPVTSVTIGIITALSATCTTQGTVVAIFTIPASYTPTGAQNVVVTFPPPPNQTHSAVFTLTGGFTINP